MLVIFEAILCPLDVRKGRTFGKEGVFKELCVKVVSFSKVVLLDFFVVVIMFGQRASIGCQKDDKPEKSPKENGKLPQIGWKSPSQDLNRETP